MPEVKKGYVRVKVRATSVNPVDWKIREGNFGGSFPIVLGHDSAGIPPPVSLLSSCILLPLLILHSTSSPPLNFPLFTVGRSD